MNHESIVRGISCARRIVTIGIFFALFLSTEVSAKPPFRLGARLLTPQEERYVKEREIREIRPNQLALQRYYLSPGEKIGLASSVKNYEYLPKVGSQGNQGSCVAWAVCYYYKTYQESKEHNWGQPDPNIDPQHIFSPAFAYNLENRGYDGGSSILGVMENVIVDHGCATWQGMPYNESDYTSWPAEEVWRNAIPYRAKDWNSIILVTDIGIESLKQHLANGDLAVIGIFVFDNFRYEYPNDTTGINNGVLFDNSGMLHGGHALTVIGYDDDKSYNDGTETKYGAFKVVNSWDSDWGVQDPDIGTKGFCWISYTYMRNKLVFFAYIMTDRQAYTPTAYGTFGLDHSKRGELNVTFEGGNDKYNPDWEFECLPNLGGSWYEKDGAWHEAEHPVNQNIVVDLTSHTAHFDKKIWLGVKDSSTDSDPKGSDTTGQVTYMSVQRVGDSEIISPDTPEDTIDGGFIYVELRANLPPNTPSSPSPANGATNQSIDVDLSWTGGDPDSEDTVTYDVYFEASDTSPDELVSNDQSGTSYGPGTLSYDTQYYWQIVATDNNGASIEGVVWNFTTGSSPNDPPDTPQAPAGPDNGTPGTSYDFTATTTDSDGDQVAFKFDWGDGSESDWTDFVDSGGSASASHSWANDGTYQVKAKAKDTSDAESAWSETHQIVISRPDLIVTSISPDTASVDQQVEIIVTLTNEGTQDVAQDFFVDVYYNPSSPPDKGQYGDEWQQITEAVQAGESIEATFTYTFDSSGDHELWAQVDADNLVSETDEDNNIYGPHTIAVSERRHENETFSLPAGKWKMISIPFTLDDPSPNAVLVDDLGPQNDAVWKLYRWNTANESYDKYPNVGDFSPGKSSWIISEDAKTVDTGPGTDVSRQSDFVINLPSGWSQIGNPFPFSIDWNEVKVRRNAEVVSILEAQARGWARDKIWYWDGQSYLVYQAPSGTIDPYEGYWARALLDCELLVSPDEAQGAKASGQTVNSKEEFLQLKAKVGELEDNFNFLGFSESAKDGYDRLDIEEAPPISPYVSLFFPHPEWEKNKGDYTQDIRTRSSQAGLTWFWDFQVKTDQLKKEIILEWDNTSVIPEELYLYLTDSLSNVLADMKKKNSYGFSPSSELESFKIIATYEALPLPEDLNLTEVYGYPNPAHGAGAKFHFHLTSWAKVTIKIYTISGELVRTLVEDKVFLPGAYEEPWEEKNDKGEKLVRGVYIFIIQAGNPAKVISKSGKIALLE